MVPFAGLRGLHGANSHYEIGCRILAYIFDSVFVVGGGKANRTWSELVRLSIDRDLYRAFAYQPKLAVLVPVGSMGRCTRMKRSFVNFYLLSGGRLAVYDVAELSGTVCICFRLKIIEAEDSGG
jgi:hypothetical protein